MYLSSLLMKNFRCFDNSNHTINFNPGLTVLVGENDSGKSAIMDAIKIVLGTTDLSWNRIELDDFHNEDTTLEIMIVCKFSDLTSEEQAAFLECLTYEDSAKGKTPHLYLHWQCKYLSTFKPPRPISSLSAGKDGSGGAPTAEARELLRATYLRALRDAYSDMKSGRHSRLSQIMQHVSAVDQGDNKYVEGMDLQKLSIIGIANLSNELLAGHSALADVNRDMTKILSEQMLLKEDTIKTRLEVAGTKSNDLQKEMALLEKLDLAVDKDASAMHGKVGHGTSNIMSMACELLLHKEAEGENKSSFLLIEEPEAHIHAQRQLKLIQSLENEAERNNQQVIMTTHSPLLASVVKLSNIVIVKEGNAYPLAEQYTKLEEDDYHFLEKYLDATKANLFFARSVVIVEGPGEALLLPTLATLLGYSFTDYGTSLVDVRSTGLRRYAKIFQRKNEKEKLNVKISCITDRDIMPNCGPALCINEKYTQDKTTWPNMNDRKWRAEADFTTAQAVEHIKEIKKRADGQQVKTFVSEQWTLEYDLVFAGWGHDSMEEALIISLIKSTYVSDNWDKQKERIKNKLRAFESKEEKASYFYSFFASKKTSKAEFAQQLAYELEKSFAGKSDELRQMLPDYLIEAVEYVVKG